MILCDTEIIERCGKGMINPFTTEQIKTNSKGEKILSYGINSYGYDIRLDSRIKIVTHPHPLDPHGVQKNIFSDAIIEGHVEMYPGQIILAQSYECIKVPRDILVISHGKSSYSRCGIIVNMTPLDPEWEGYITMCIINNSPLPVRIYEGEGITQLVFYKADKVCKTSYADRGGKYHKSTGIQTARA